MVVLVPIITVSEINRHEHWRRSHERHEAQKFRTRFAFSQGFEAPKFPVIITLTRISPRKLDDDNLRPALKWVRDTVADILIPGLKPGRADDDMRISWQYAQEKSKTHGVRVAIIPV